MEGQVHEGFQDSSQWCHQCHQIPPVWKPSQTPPAGAWPEPLTLNTAGPQAWLRVAGVGLLGAVAEDPGVHLCTLAGLPMVTQHPDSSGMGTGTEGISRPPPTFTAARLMAHRQSQPEEIRVILHSEGGDRELGGRGRLGRAGILVCHIREVLSYGELILERSGLVRLPPDCSFLRHVAPVTLPNFPSR